MNTFKKKQDDLEEIREHKLKGALIRARWQQLTEGEKPSKFFLNLENRNFVSKHIRELKGENNTKISEPNKILKEMGKFYEHLYTKKETTDINTTNYAHIEKKLTKINKDERVSLEKDISLEDLKYIVFKSKNNKSPGPDGYSNEFYKTFWDQIKILLLKLMNYYRKNGFLNKSQLSGVITCIPKGGKLRNDLKNWRPITLLNSIYKFYSGILAERIKILLPKIIHQDQKGFINGRFIGENTRLIYDIINECEIQNLDGLIILIDFEKAFDSISWDFILKSLEKFNFGETTIKWVRSLQIGSNSKILQNGYLSEEIMLGRGCRQGDPISPYLFILAAEFLAEAIRNNTNIKGITIHNKEHKLSTYADDTTLFTRYNENSIRSCMKTLLEFELISGLKVNQEKTKVIQLGANRDNRMNLCTELNMMWNHKFTALGITYDVNNMKTITDQNISNKLIEINKTIALWRGRNITPVGKIVLIKSTLISKITHILLSLPSPKNESMKTLENVFRNFIWEQKPPKFRKEILENPYNMGGLKMTNLISFDHSLKISWLKRLKNQDDGWEQFPRHFDIHKIVIFGDKFPQLIIGNIQNQFWKDVVIACATLQQMIKKENTTAFNIPLWFNSDINLTFKKCWFQKGYSKLGDILDKDGNIFTIKDMTEKGLFLNFLDYEKLRFDVSKITLINNNNNMYGPYLPHILFKIGYNGKGCAKTYNCLMNCNYNIITEVRNNWEQVLEEEIPHYIIEKSFKNLQKMKEGSFTKYLQFKMLHRRIVTNKKLLEMGIADSSKCPYCEEQEETIEHAFLYCKTVKNFWGEIESWLKRHIDNSIKIPDMDKIMGTGQPEGIIDKTIIATKRVIYRNRQIGKAYNITEVKSCLRNQMQIEEYQSSIEGTYLTFLKTWEAVYGLIY